MGPQLPSRNHWLGTRRRLPILPEETRWLPPINGIESFTISLVTDYPKGKSFVYLEGLDILSADKKKKVIEAVRRKEGRLRGIGEKTLVGEGYPRNH